MSESRWWSKTSRARTSLPWLILACFVIGPVIIAAASPYQAARPAVYIVASLAGVLAMALLLVQPLLAAGYLPGLSPAQMRRGHLWTGSIFAACVAIHIGGLYLTSPQDALDALLLTSPTPFSVYGVIGMWGVLLTLILVALRTQVGLRYSAWQIIHNAVAAIVVICSVVHALMIEGTMGTISKWSLCLAIVAVTAIVIVHLRVVKIRPKT